MQKSDIQLSGNLPDNICHICNKRIKTKTICGDQKHKICFMCDTQIRIGNNYVYPFCRGKFFDKCYLCPEKTYKDFICKQHYFERQSNNIEKTIGNISDNYFGNNKNQFDQSKKINQELTKELIRQSQILNHKIIRDTIIGNILFDVSLIFSEIDQDNSQPQFICIIYFELIKEYNSYLKKKYGQQSCSKLGYKLIPIRKQI